MSLPPRAGGNNIRPPPFTVPDEAGYFCPGCDAVEFVSCTQDGRAYLEMPRHLPCCGVCVCGPCWTKLLTAGGKPGKTGKGGKKKRGSDGGACCPRCECVLPMTGGTVEYYAMMTKNAHNGRAWAQLLVGEVCDSRGQSGQAAEWYRQAAEQNNIHAQYLLGVCFHQGDGVVPSSEAAVEWYGRAAARGHLSATYNLGCMLLHASPKTMDEGMRLISAAAAKGHASARGMIKQMRSKLHIASQTLPKDVSARLGLDEAVPKVPRQDGSLATGQCLYCLSSGAEERPLMRCGGCKVALFCGAKCQKAAWPKHKAGCKREQARVRALLKEEEDATVLRHHVERAGQRTTAE